MSLLIFEWLIVNCFRFFFSTRNFPAILKVLILESQRSTQHIQQLKFPSLSGHSFDCHTIRNRILTQKKCHGVIFPKSGSELPPTTRDSSFKSRKTKKEMHQQRSHQVWVCKAFGGNKRTQLPISTSATVIFERMRSNIPQHNDMCRQ